MSDMQELSVSIFGSQYTLRSDTPAAVVQELAARVDERMREAASNAGPVGVDRLAVLAALNFADDLARLERDAHERDAARRERIARLTVLLADEVGKPGVHGV
jgi:cell division protein ZapA (FtsZ GTPase activity inhibitor)